MSVRLEVQSERGVKSHDFPGPKVLLGRSTRCDLRFNDAPASEVVSWEHAALELGDELVIRDLGSTNETFVNDEPVKEHVLGAGDTIRLGRTGPVIRIVEFSVPQPQREDRARQPGPIGFSKGPGAADQIVSEVEVVAVPPAPQEVRRNQMIPVAAQPVNLAPKRGRETRQLLSQALRQSRRTWAALILVAGAGLLTLVVLLVSSFIGDDPDNIGANLYPRVLKSTVLVQTADSLGSAVLVDAKRRLLVTNFHVVGVSDEVEIYVPIYDGEGNLLTQMSDYETDFLNRIGIRGRVVVRDISRDLAVVQLDQLWDGAREVRLASTLPSAGDVVHSIGNPVGATQGLWIYTSGRVRQVQQYVNVDANFGVFEANAILTDSALNHGDSGGPLVNNSGELVGIAVLAHPIEKVSAFAAGDEVRWILDAADRKLKQQSAADD